MLIYNEYLKKIGVGKNTYPLGNSCSHEKELDKEAGVIPCQTWNLDRTLAMELYTYILYFKDHTKGYPIFCKDKLEWDNILEEMADGFKDYITKDIGHKNIRKLNHSLNLLKRYWMDLWW